MERLARIPERSILPSPDPIGIGTPDVESLTSYLKRLAQAIATTLRYLLSELVYKDGRGVRTVGWANWMTRASSVNSGGEETDRILKVLTRLTGRTSLQSLTLLPVRGILAPRPSVLKRVRAWCPKCFEDMRNSNAVIYEKLIWSLNPSTICLSHLQPLHTVCPHCGNEQRILAANSVPGFCNSCIGWLGYDADEENQFRALEVNAWVSRALGELVTALPHFDVQSFSDNLRSATMHVANLVAGGSVRELSRLGPSYSRILSSLRDGRTVSLRLLLEGVHGLGLSMSDLFQTDCGVCPAPMPVHADETVRPHYSTEARRQILKKELKSPQPRSPNELAASLGYSCTAELWRADRELYTELASKAPQRKRIPRDQTRLNEIKAKAKEALDRSYDQGFPKSVKEIAKELGNFKEGTLRSWFPEQCKSITAKRNSHIQSVCETFLNDALAQNPIPTLSDVARKSGQTIAILEQRAPDLCKKLKMARKDRASQELSDLRESALSLMSQNPPLTGIDFANRLEISFTDLKRKLPDIARQVINRFRAYRDQESLNSTMSTFVAVQSAVQTLQAAGEQPSAQRIAQNIHEKRHDWTLLSDARKHAVTGR